MDEYTRSGRPEKREFVDPINYPPTFVVVMARHNDHQKMKSFLPRHGSWGNIPYLMRSGSAMRIVAIWRVLISGVNAPVVWLLGFSLNFSFFSLVFKLPLSLCPFTFSNSFTIIALCSFFYNLFHLAIFFELSPVVASFKVCFLFSLSFCFLWHRLLCMV